MGGHLTWHIAPTRQLHKYGALVSPPGSAARACWPPKLTTKQTRTSLSPSQRIFLFETSTKLPQDLLRKEQ